MGIYIRGMEMPGSCRECRFDRAGWCLATDRIDSRTRFVKFATYDSPQEWCPLVPVPDHGRLIEESKVLDIVSDWCPDDDGSVGKDGDLREMLDEIEALPTIIPAEENNNDR